MQPTATDWWWANSDLTGVGSSFVERELKVDGSLLDLEVPAKILDFCDPGDGGVNFIDEQGSIYNVLNDLLELTPVLDQSTTPFDFRAADLTGPNCDQAVAIQEEGPGSFDIYLVNPGSFWSRLSGPISDLAATILFFTDQNAPIAVAVGRDPSTGEAVVWSAFADQLDIVFFDTRTNETSFFSGVDDDGESGVVVAGADGQVFQADDLPPIFADGFESGDTSRWSDEVP